MENFEFFAKLIKQRKAELMVQRSKIQDLVETHACRRPKEGYEFFLEMHLEREKLFAADHELNNVLHQIDLCTKDLEDSR